MSNGQQREIVVSGIRSTGFLHLGNYFGAIRNYVRMQEDYDCYFFIADWHSLTTLSDTGGLSGSVHRVLAEYIASGIDPAKATLYVQSDIPEIAELYLLLNMLAYKGELEKTASFKDKVRLQPENVNAGLLTYPVLMTADILVHRGVKVPVGKDQEQHLEMARNFAQRFNHRYGAQVFPEPHPFNFGQSLLKVPSLDGAGKMSKSENQMATLYLNDDDDLIRKKVMKAQTAAGPAEPNTPMPEAVENLFLLMRLVSDDATVLQYTAAYNDAVIRYGDMKKSLAEDMVRFITPIRTTARELEKDKGYLHKVMREGADRARASAAATLKEVRRAMGMSYYNLP
jgi:tryptophanyl-tRNA synthetase